MRGYRPPLPIIERLESKTDRVGDCWIWSGYTDKDGYGRIMMGSRLDGSRGARGVHQVSFEHFVGPIPDGLEIDHECFQRACWNPAHLRAVTQAVNKAHLSELGLEARREALVTARAARWM